MVGEDNECGTMQPSARAGLQLHKVAPSFSLMAALTVCEGGPSVC